MKTVIKDSHYWKVYNQKRKEYLTQKKREARAKLKDLVVDTVNNISVVDNSIADQQELMSTTISEVVDLEIEIYNQEVYNRAGTQDPNRFFTFPDGRKIVRAKCGCNPLGETYDWCKDDCAYFIYWRERNRKIKLVKQF